MKIQILLLIFYFITGIIILSSLKGAGDKDSLKALRKIKINMIMSALCIVLSLGTSLYFCFKQDLPDTIIYLFTGVIWMFTTNCWYKTYFKL